jgi:hypothetical protein
MTEGWGQFFMTQRGQFRMSFDMSERPIASRSKVRLGSDR